MRIRSKYVKAMNEIMADQELKQKIIDQSSIPSGSIASNRPWYAASHNVVKVAVSCVIILILVMTGSNMFENKEAPNPSHPYRSLVITAYAADGAPFEVKPNINFPLGQYSVTMNTVPGFPITIESKDSDKIEIQTSEGQLLSWSPTNPQVIFLGQKATITSSETIYWSPASEDTQMSEENTITVTAYQKNQELAHTAIHITLGENNMYTGKLLDEI